MKTVYLVRHGQSEINIHNYAFGDEKSPLTALGHAQADQIAQRCSKLKIDVIISSTMLRAKETATAISRINPVAIELSDIFQERKNPSILNSNDRYKEPLRSKRDAWLASFYVENQQVEDGDNFATITKRAKRAMAFLENRTEDTILVVAHGFILTTLLALIIIGDSITPEELKDFMLRVKMENTGISVLQYDFEGTEMYDNMKLSGWSMRMWNDHAHLG